MSNGTYVPWDDINEFDTLPGGCYHFSAESEIGESNAGKLMVRNTYTVMQPAEQAGRKFFDYLTLGTDEQPKVFVKDAPGASNFKKVMKAAQVPPGSLEQMSAGLNGSQFMADVNEVKQKDDASFRPGEVINRITAYYRLGERAPGLTPKGPGVGGGGVVAPVAPAPPAMPAMSSTATAPVAPTAPPQQAPPAAPVAAAQPVPQVPTAAAPVAPAPPTVPNTPVAPAPPAAASGGQMLRCTLCQNDIPMAEFAAHANWHLANPGVQWQPGMG